MGDLLIIDDFALQALDAADTADVHELIVEHHRSAAAVVTSNCEPVEWLGSWPIPCWPSGPSTGRDDRRDGGGGSHATGERHSNAIL